MQKFDNFTECYEKLAYDVMTNYDHESSPRGKKIKEKLCVSFSLADPRNRLLYSKARKQSIEYVIAEALWYLSGSSSTEWISNYSSFWKAISDNGHDANSAYGSRIFKQNDVIAQGRFSQWIYVIDELTRDRDSRRAVIHIRVPDDSIDAHLDVPCTLALQFLIRDNKLHLIVHMRSTDLVLGLGNDVPAFTLFQEKLANVLHVELGTYMHVSNSLHIYEQHDVMCREIADEAEWKSGSWHDDRDIISMPKMPSYIPMAELLTAEKTIRASMTRDELQHIVTSYVCQDNILCYMDPYWSDWVLILAAHRAGKLKLAPIHSEHKTFRDELILTTSFKGYHFYANT